DTELTPNEGYTAGSQSIQFGGVALRLACAEVRSLFLDHVAASHGLARAGLAVEDGPIPDRGQETGHHYWALAAAVDSAGRATAVEAVAAVAPGHVEWDGVDPLNPAQEEARWLLRQPTVDRIVGAPPAAPAPGAARREATYTRMHIAHASIGPSAALALYQGG